MKVSEQIKIWNQIEVLEELIGELLSKLPMVTTIVQGDEE
jgi:hypothetical protein